MSEGQADAALLEALRGGDEDALEALLVRHQGRILRFSLRMCRNPDAAQDVAQETLLAAARSLRAFRAEASLSTWLFTIARSFCIKSRRKRPPAGSEVSLEDAAAALPDPSRGPEERAHEREVADALEVALRDLDPGPREVLLLRDMEGFTAPEVAQITGLSVEAVKSRLHRARAAVRARLAPLLQPAPLPSPGCPDVVALLSRPLEGDVPEGACAEMERHVSTCPACAARCQGLREIRERCRRAPEPVGRPLADLRPAVRSGP